MNITELLSKMTLEQKAAQMTQYAAFILDEGSIERTGPMQSLNVTQSDLDTCGSLFNLAQPEDRQKYQNNHMAADPNKIPIIFMQDVIHGFRTIYPIPLGMAASFDEALTEECAAMAARQATAFGVDVTFSPMVDMSRDARWGRVMEGSGEDLLLGCVMAAAQVRGYLSEGLQACVKHFAGYGAGEAGRDYNTVDMSENRLREHYLPAYKAALDAGAKFIMPSFNSLNGVPSVANKWLMNKVLREEWGFDGMVVSDYAALGELIPHGISGGNDDSAYLALNAGCDMEMMTTCYIHGLKKMLDKKQITMEQIDACVERILRTKEAMGLFEHPEGKADPEKFHALELCEAHRAIARKAAEQTAVLLKNDGVLPLCDKAKKVAVIGPFADDGRLIGFWSVNGKPSEAITILQGIRNRLPDAEVRTCAGCMGALLSEDNSLLPQAIKLAQWADQVILVLGEDCDFSGEGNSRAVLEMSSAQLALSEAVHAHCKETAVVLLTGRPLALTDLEKNCRAILCMWQPGTEGGNAAARLLYGDVAPCGHLPMSFPRATGQEPISYDVYSTGRPVADPINGCGNNYQSHYLDIPVAPLYPFGFGLTYTTFELENVRLSSDALTPGETIEISAELCNTGSREGTALLQLYTHDLIGSVVRPVRELKAFRKETLAPGERKTVSFPITEEMLRFYTLDKGFASEPGAFEAILALNAWDGTPLRFILK